MRKIGLSIMILATGIAGLASRAFGADVEPRRTPPAVVRIGLVSSLFREVPMPLVMAMMRPLGSFMKAQTGVGGELVPGGDYGNLGQLLTNNQVQLGIFHGVEYAWVREKHPELRPLMIAVNQQRHLRAVLTVREGSPIERFEDLEGVKLALARGTREHCHLFLERHCQECGQKPDKFFEKICKQANAEDALDDLVDDEVQAAIIDGVALDCYQSRKPGRFAKLRIVKQSEIFPAGVIVYHPGSLDEETLQSFREGMINANQTTLGKQMMMLWKLTSFEPVPEDYEETLTNIVEFYPPPAPVAKAAK